MGGWVSTHHSLRKCLITLHGAGGKTHLATQQLRHVHLSTTIREVQASHGRGHGTADYSNSPLYPFPFRFFPTGLRALQTTVPPIVSVTTFVHIRHLHAFLRRYNTTTTWFESDAVTGRGRSEAVFGGRLAMRTTQGSSG